MNFLKLRSKAHGFTPLSGLLVLIIVVMVSGVGYYVYQAQKKTNSIYAKLGGTTNTLKTAKDATSPAAKTDLPTNPLSPKPAPPGASPAPATPSPTPSPSKTVGDADNGTTITLHKNQTLIVQLASTYWTINDATNTGVIKMVGQPVIKATPSSYPGSGNGTATAQFSALAAGTTTITASRTSCGEAMGCVGDQGKYQITVVVQL